jgi:hypothetical protein
MSQHQGARKPAQKRRMGSGGRRDLIARWAAERDGRESRLLPTESWRVHRCQMDPSDPLPLPPDIGARARLRGRGRAGGTGPNALLLLLLMSPEPLPLLPPSAVVPSVALSGSDLLPSCVVAKRVVEFEGPAGAWANGATVAFSGSSSSSESERAVTKLPVRSEPASS